MITITLTGTMYGTNLRKLRVSEEDVQRGTKEGSRRGVGLSGQPDKNPPTTEGAHLKIRENDDRLRVRFEKKRRCSIQSLSHSGHPVVQLTCVFGFDQSPTLL